MLLRAVLLSGLMLLTACGLFAPSVDKTLAKQPKLRAECDAKSAAGELVGYYSLTDCKATALEAAMTKAKYPYTDLLQDYTDEVRMVALEVDNGERTQASAQIVMNQAYDAWIVAEGERCASDTYLQQQREIGVLDPRPLFDRMATPKTFACFNVAVEK